MLLKPKGKGKDTQVFSLHEWSVVYIFLVGYAALHVAVWLCEHMSVCVHMHMPCMHTHTHAPTRVHTHTHTQPHGP